MTDYTKNIYIGNTGIPILQIVPFESTKIKTLAGDYVKAYDWNNATDPNKDTYATIYIKRLVLGSLFRIYYDVPIPLDKVIFVTDEKGKDFLLEHYLYIIAKSVSGRGYLFDRDFVEENGKYYVTLKINSLESGENIHHIEFFYDTLLDREVSFKVYSIITVLKTEIQGNVNIGFGSVQLKDVSGNIINPSTEETLQNIDSKLQTIMQKIGGGATLSYEDVTIATEHGATYTDIEKMFDKNLFTYGTLDLPNSGEFIVVLNEPRKLSGIVIFGGSPSDWTNISYSIDYEDGSGDSGNVQSITDIGGYIPVNPTKTVMSFTLKNNSGTAYSFNIYELWIKIAYDVSAVTTLRKVGDTTLTSRNWSLDFEKLQNLDVLLSTRASETTAQAILDKLNTLDTANISGIVIKGGVVDTEVEIQHSEQFGSSPSANTEYTIDFDSTGWEKGRLYIMADQPLDVSIQVYSNKAGVWYDVDGLGILSSDFKTDKANWIDIDRMISFRVRYVTGDTAPTDVYFIFIKKA